MNLYQLRYFSVLAGTQHYGKAAEKLCIAQPSLSQAISQLEQELGVQLFERKGRSSSLTSAGEQFLTYVNKSLAILDNGISAMEHIFPRRGMYPSRIHPSPWNSIYPRTRRRFF